MKDKKLYSNSQAAKALGIVTSSMYRWRKRAHVPTAGLLNEDQMRIVARHILANKTNVRIHVNAKAFLDSSYRQSPIAPPAPEPEPVPANRLPLSSGEIMCLDRASEALKKAVHANDRLYEMGNQIEVLTLALKEIKESIHNLTQDLAEMRKAEPEASPTASDYDPVELIFRTIKALS